MGGGTNRCSVIFDDAQGTEDEGDASIEGANLIGGMSYNLKDSYLVHSHAPILKRSPWLVVPRPPWLKASLGTEVLARTFLLWVAWWMASISSGLIAVELK